MSAAVHLSLWSQVRLAHAAVQDLAERRALDVLHVKGPALPEVLSRSGRASADADVLVRPGHVDVLTDSLAGAGWRRLTTFGSGSMFEHAQTYRHEVWGALDVHRCYPGLEMDADDAFEALWTRRDLVDLANVPCAVPSFTDHALLLLLHAARGGGDAWAAYDIDRAFWRRGATHQEDVRARAGELGARVALAAALGELDQFGGETAVPLWETVSRPSSRLDEWRARLQSAPNRVQALHVLVRAVMVNRDHLALELGHPPGAVDVIRAQARRVRRLAQDLRDSLGRHTS